MKSIRSILSVLLSGIMLAAMLAGCTGAPDETTAEETTDDIAVGIVLTGGENGDFLNIVRSENASQIVLAATSALVKAYKEYVPEVDVSDDWGYEPGSKDYETLSGRCEILVGLTNREQSGLASEGLNFKDWAIKKIGNKLVIAAGNDWSLRYACELFAASLDKGKDGKVRYVGPESGKSEFSRLVITTNQKTSSVEIYDITAAGSVKDALWSKTYTAYNIADARVREYGGQTVILAAYGASYASIVDYETKKNLWSTSVAPSNPHACELIPCDGGYAVAVTGTDGNAVRFYDASRPGTEYTEVALPDAHGALYDPDSGAVYCIGLNVLTAYEVKLTGGKPSVKERTELSAVIPSTNAHELQPMYGDHDKMWVTTGSAVYLYSKSSKSFSSSFGSISASVSRNNVKGIGNYEDGGVILITPDGEFKSWTSATLSFFTDGKYETKIKIAGGGFYKARAFNPAYN
ncbi:MAG: DUF6528 family protein [Clostridia bacterium]|nr:DUF6528 family protein [Clostridia bacterium]